MSFFQVSTHFSNYCYELFDVISGLLDVYNICMIDVYFLNSCLS